MREQLLQELMIISEEEKKYQAGQGNIEKQLYAKESISEIDRELLLKRGRLITVRPHSRFVGFSGAQTQLCRDDVCGAGKYYAYHRGKRIDTA